MHFKKVHCLIRQLSQIEQKSPFSPILPLYLPYTFQISPFYRHVFNGSYLASHHNYRLKNSTKKNKLNAPHLKTTQTYHFQVW
jgi:hypothetical protein